MSTFSKVTRPMRHVAVFARENGPLTILVLVLLFALVRYDGFYNSFNVSTILSSTDLLCIGLMAIGLTFVISTGEIDLSVAGIAVVTSIVVAQLAPIGAGIAVAGGIAAGAALGLVNGLLVAYGGLPSFIVTLAMLLGTRGLSLIISGNGKIPVDYEFPLVQFYNFKFFGLVPAPFLVVALIAGIAWIVFSRSAFGLHVLAIGGDKDSSELMGLPSARIRTLVFVITGALSGLAGVFLLAKTTTGNPLEAANWELTAIAAVVLGGTLLTGGKGSILWTLVGVALLTIVFQVLNYENGQGIAINSYWQNVIRGLFVLAIVVTQALGSRTVRLRMARSRVATA